MLRRGCVFHGSLWLSLLLHGCRGYVSSHTVFSLSLRDTNHLDNRSRVVSLRSAQGIKTPTLEVLPSSPLPSRRRLPQREQAWRRSAAGRPRAPSRKNVRDSSVARWRQFSSVRGILRLVRNPAQSTMVVDRVRLIVQDLERLVDGR